MTIMHITRWLLRRFPARGVLSAPRPHLQPCQMPTRPRPTTFIAGANAHCTSSDPCGHQVKLPPHLGVQQTKCCPPRKRFLCPERQP